MRSTLHDRLEISEGDGLEVVGPAAAGVADRRLEPDPSSARARRPHGARPRREAHPLGCAVSGADRATPPRSFDGPASTTSRSLRPLGADVPFCLVGGRARVTGIGDVVERLPFVPSHLHAHHAAVRRSRRPRSIACGTTLAGRRGEPDNDLESAAMKVDARLDEWRQRIEAATGVRHARGERVDVVRRGRSP